MPKCPQLQLANMKHGTKTCIADAVRVVLKSGCESATWKGIAFADWRPRCYSTPSGQRLEPQHLRLNIYSIDMLHSMSRSNSPAECQPVGLVRPKCRLDLTWAEGPLG
jgi:hypothetical protein